MFNTTLLKMMSNFIPNKFIKVVPKDPPCITNDIKRKIKRQNSMHKIYKRHGYLNAYKTSHGLGGPRKFAHSGAVSEIAPSGASFGKKYQ